MTTMPFLVTTEGRRKLQISEQHPAWGEEISENMVFFFFFLSQSLVFLQFPLDLVHALPSRHLGVQSSEANFLPSRLLHHFPRLNLFSPTIFHSLLLTNASSI